MKIITLFKKLWKIFLTHSLIITIISVTTYNSYKKEKSLEKIEKELKILENCLKEMEIYIGEKEVTYALDYTVLECVDLKLKPLELGDSVWKGTKEVYVLHVNCDYKVDPDCEKVKLYSPGVANTQNEIHHTADTLGGSSGAPLFDAETNKVVGLHHAGVPTENFNLAVRLDKILNHYRGEL